MDLYYSHLRIIRWVFFRALTSENTFVGSYFTQNYISLSIYIYTFLNRDACTWKRQFFFLNSEYFSTKSKSANIRIHGLISIHITLPFDVWDYYKLNTVFSSFVLRNLSYIGYGRKFERSALIVRRIVQPSH